MHKNIYTRMRFAQVESDLKLLQVKLGEILRRTDITSSQWSEYRLGHRTPVFEKWGKIQAALAAIKKEAKDAK